MCCLDSCFVQETAPADACAPAASSPAHAAQPIPAQQRPSLRQAAQPKQAATRRPAATAGVAATCSSVWSTAVGTYSHTAAAAHLAQKMGQRGEPCASSGRLDRMHEYCVTAAGDFT